MAKKSRTREARQRRRKQRRQNRRLLILAFIVVVAVVAVAVAIVSNQPVDARLPDELSARYDGVPRGFSSVGYPRLGNADAPVTVEEYASFACPGCEALHSASFEDLLERVKAEQVLFTYVPLNTGSIPNAEGASRAALCAGEQGMFWEMRDVLFDWQTRYGNTAFSQNRLLAGVENLGLNSGAFSSCFNSAAISETLATAANEGVSSTPTLRVNGVTVEASQSGQIPSSATILQAIDSATPDDWWTRGEESEPAPAAEPAAETEASQPVAGETAPTAAAIADDPVQATDDSQPEGADEAETQPSPEPAEAEADSEAEQEADG